MLKSDLSMKSWSWELDVMSYPVKFGNLTLWMVGELSKQQQRAAPGG